MRRVVPWVLMLAALLVMAAAKPDSDQREVVEMPFVVPPHHEARLIELDRQAIERAYVAYVQSLFSVWMKDSAGQPERAARGVQQARRAYVGSIRAIEQREERQ